MNPQYVAANEVHTIPEKLSEYLIEPFTNFGILICLIIMFANIYMFRKLWKIKRRDYIEIINLFTIGIYVVFSIISAVLVSRLGPHGVLMEDDCDKAYMTFPRALFSIVIAINIIYFVINLITKLKKDKEYSETVKRGYFAEENVETDEEEKTNINNRVNIYSFIDNIKEKIDIDEIKDKVNNITEDIKDTIENIKNKD